ncbi:hypothetical protein ALC53_12268 [Atta colombica]|uniref:Uncharacterized protein n=1 Tax=Atta colombica TaxID=520822 RepID=A0A195AZ21_9HYME|nr:hypothetical protein ALC53_12268 [Atta colombica]
MKGKQCKEQAEVEGKAKMRKRAGCKNRCRFAGQESPVHFRKLSKIFSAGDESNKLTQRKRTQKKRKGAVPEAEEVARTMLVLAAGFLNRNSAAYNPHYPSI